MRINILQILIRSLLAGWILTAGAGQSAFAHEFTAAIIGGNPVSDTLVEETVRGFIVATDERDGHPDETSDGHLGGLDVQIRVLPETAADSIDQLVGTPTDPAEIAILLGPERPATERVERVVGPDTILIRPGRLPSRRIRDSSDFGERFRDLFGRLPTDAAAQGYNAARRIDAALRPHAGFSERAALEAALAASSAGIDW